MDDQNVKRIVEEVVREQFSSDAIRSVRVDMGTDDEGDRVLQVTIIVSKAFQKHDRAKILGLVRHIRSRLETEDSQGFPIVDFVSDAEVRKTERAFA